jgi:anti-sigma regulatory factor (Ser/Thr protein kinase)
VEDEIGGRGRGRAPALLTLPPSPTSVREARRFLLQRCPELGLHDERCDDALLLVSELVTNAVLHGRSDVCVELTRAHGRVRVAVLDENSRRPIPVREDPDALDGRGLALVDAVADRWGVDQRDYGKSVWFELSVA